MKEIVLIDAYLKNFESTKVLINLVNQCIDNQYEFFIVSGKNNIPRQIIDKSRGFLFDTENLYVQTEDIEYEKIPYIVVPAWNFVFYSKYLNYGSTPSYAYPVAKQFLSSILLLKNWGYDIVHYIQYDSELPVEDLIINKELLSNSDYDSIVYRTPLSDDEFLAAPGSYNLNKFSHEFIYEKFSNLYSELDDCRFVHEKYINKHLCKNPNVLENNNKTRINFISTLDFAFGWAIFDYNEEFFIFFRNTEDITHTIKIITDTKIDTIYVNPENYYYVSIGDKSTTRFICLKNETVLCDMDLSNKETYDKWVGCNRMEKI